MPGIPQVVRFDNEFLEGKKSMTTPKGGLLFTDPDEINWGYHKKMQRIIRDMISPLDLRFDLLYIKPDPRNLKEFLVAVGTLQNPILIWRRFYNSANTPTNVIAMPLKCYTVPQFVELSTEDIKKSINSCELKTEMILAEYRQERMIK